MRLFHPLGFMLASPIESPEEGLSYFAEAAVEDKYDGIRAQAHVADGEVKFFSRTRDEITESFPELPGALAGLPQDAILDGEIVAWEYPKELSNTQQVVDEAASEASEQKAVNLGRARPFSVLQQTAGKEESQRQNAAGGSGRVPGVRRIVCGRRVSDGSSAAGAGGDSGCVAGGAAAKALTTEGAEVHRGKRQLKGRWPSMRISSRGGSRRRASFARRCFAPRRLRNWKSFLPLRRREAMKD